MSKSHAGETLSLEAVLDVARASGADGPWEIRPPKDERGTFYVANLTEVRADQVQLHLDRHDGTLRDRVTFEDYPPIAKAVSLGIAFHQGELYGWPNVAQNALAAALGFTLAVSGFVAWWMRRPAGSLGVPAVPSSASAGKGMLVLVVVLALLLPLMGASLALALLLDRFVFRRIGWFRTEPALVPGA